MTRSRRRRHRRRRKNFLILIALPLLLLLLLLTLWYSLAHASTPNIVARVLFSETAGCSRQERTLVAGVMHNRIANPAFGNSPTLQAVALQPGAFSCIGDPHNANWLKTAHPEQMSPAEHAVWQECLACATGPIPPALGPSGRPLVYYHDKSITKPASWDNAKWRAIRELSTEHFVFYSILPAEQPRR